MFQNYRKFGLSTGVKTPALAVINTGKKVTVILHTTTVVEATAKRITLRDGGWDTISTRAVINRALQELGTPYGLHRVKGKTVLVEDRDIGFSRVLDVVKPFRDGMQIKRVSHA